MISGKMVHIHPQATLLSKCFQQDSFTYVMVRSHDHNTYVICHIAATSLLLHCPQPRLYSVPFAMLVCAYCLFLLHSANCLHMYLMPVHLPDRNLDWYQVDRGDFMQCWLVQDKQTGRTRTTGSRASWTQFIARPEVRLLLGEFLDSLLHLGHSPAPLPCTGHHCS